MMQDLLEKVLSKFLLLYKKLISPFFPPCCRFTPSCSQYMRDALEREGLFRGIFLGGKRLFICHPWHAGGYDPVPAKEVV